MHEHCSSCPTISNCSTIPVAPSHPGTTKVQPLGGGGGAPCGGSKPLVGCVTDTISTEAASLVVMVLQNISTDHHSFASEERCTEM